MRFIPLESHEVRLAAESGLAPSVHLLDRTAILAVNSALAAGRPLLLRGEPGTGKSQLARAAAAALGRAFVPWVTDARTESRDLLYTLDLVARLAAAQAQESHSLELFVHPGPLWWAFDWVGAEEQAARANARTYNGPSGWKAGDGAVLLIDEIDKADPSVPNGLLDALGNSRFDTPLHVPVSCTGVAPLVIVTTNEERSLPAAFVRRCLVIRLELPSDPEALIAHFCRLGEAHVRVGTLGAANDDVLRKAAQLIAADRAADGGRADVDWRPGAAEYLDLVRVVAAQESAPDAQLRLIDEVGRFVLRKTLA
jgi:MoxR-like ATPase